MGSNMPAAVALQAGVCIDIFAVTNEYTTPKNIHCSSKGITLNFIIHICTSRVSRSFGFIATLRCRMNVICRILYRNVLILLVWLDSTQKVYIYRTWRVQFHIHIAEFQQNIECDCL